jgi:hypothetical protein
MVILFKFSGQKKCHPDYRGIVQALKNMAVDSLCSISNILPGFNSFLPRILPVPGRN